MLRSGTTDLNSCLLGTLVMKGDSLSMVLNCHKPGTSLPSPGGSSKGKKPSPLWPQKMHGQKGGIQLNAVDKGQFP